MLTTLPDDEAIEPREVDPLRLAAKYATSGPRYTSYPTAPYFEDQNALASYRAWCEAAALDSVAPLSLYLHVPFCRDICYYCACNKTVTREQGVGARYLANLEREIELRSTLVGGQRPVTQMHWGGGTPTYLEDAELTQLMHILASHFHLTDRPDREYSLEIDPRTVSTESLALLRGLGFNRISMGIQDFDPLVQKSVNRVQRYEDVADLVSAARNLKYRSLSFDLIYGLPHQDETSMRQTLRQVIALGPDRIACYNYAHLPERFSSQRAIDRLTLPSPQQKMVLHQLISDVLKDAGYLHIGMDHYVLPSDDLALARQNGRLQRNFQGYSLQLADDLLGLGVSAISQLGDFYLQNERQLDAYYSTLDKGEIPVVRGYQMTAEDKLRRNIIMTLACQLELNIETLEAEFDIDFFSHFAACVPTLRAMSADGLLQLAGQTLRITPIGRHFIRNICMAFDAYLETPTHQKTTPQYSATV